MSKGVKQKYKNSYNELIKKYPAIKTQYLREQLRIIQKNNNAIIPNGNGTQEDPLDEEKFLKKFCEEKKDHFHFIEYECITKEEYDDKQKKIEKEKQSERDIRINEWKESERIKNEEKKRLRDQDRENGFNPRWEEPLGIW